MKHRAWTKEETMLAINLYCKLPFGKMHHANPDVVALAKLIGRSPNSVALKLGNIACLDPDLPRKGLSNYTRLDCDTWEEFSADWERLAFESELLLAKYQNRPIEKVAEIETENIPQEGKERETIIRARVNQSFFRKMIFSSYQNTCCITGINTAQLLIASHIKPWAVDVGNRLNPRNGLCLNALHDKAFDSGLISVSNDLKVIVSGKLKSHYGLKAFSTFFAEYEGVPINLPMRFLPDKTFLEYHRDVIFQG